MEEVAQAVERFRVLDESDDDVPAITNGDMGTSSSAAGKGDQTPTEEKKAVWDDVSIAHFVTFLTPYALSTLSPCQLVCHLVTLSPPSHPLSCPNTPKSGPLLGPVQVHSTNKTQNEPIRTTTPPPAPLATTPPPPPRHRNQRRTSVLDSTTFPLPPGRDQFLAIAARPPPPPCPTKEGIRRKRQGGIYHFVAPAPSTSASSDRDASLSLPPGAADAAPPPPSAAHSAELWTPRPTIPDAAPSVGLWTPRSAIPGAAHPAGRWTPVTARATMVGAALSALTSAAPQAPPCPSFPPPAPRSSWTTISPPASSAPPPSSAYSGDVARPPPPPTFVRPSSSVYSGDNNNDDDNDDDGRPIMATYPAFAAPMLPLVVTRDTALFSNPVMMISGGVARPARPPPVGRRRIEEEVEAEEAERRRVGRVRMGLRRVGGAVKGFFERK